MSIDDDVLFEDEECDTLRDLLKLAVRSGANLRYANLSNANLRYANLSNANLRYANLSNANLRYADLSDANLSDADLRYADLSNANLRYADLSDANLSNANLRYANLSNANLRYADLSDANLSDADLRYADLSGVKDLLSAAEWLSERFFFTRDGCMLVFTRKGSGTQYTIPTAWSIEVGSELTEECNALRTDECGCGVNFASWDWLQREYTSARLFLAEIAPIDLPSVVVPYNTDGKARCGRMTLVHEYK